MCLPAPLALTGMVARFLTTATGEPIAWPASLIVTVPASASGPATSTSSVNESPSMTGSPLAETSTALVPFFRVIVKLVPLIAR